MTPALKLRRKLRAGSQRAAFTALLALAGCGAKTDLARPPDAPRETDAGDPTERCLDAFAHPESASDAVLFECGLAHRLGRCFVQPRCPECVCEYYVKDRSCDARGVCGPPLDGTGCISLSTWADPPWGCTATTYEGTAACLLRSLIRAGGPCNP